MHVEGNKSCEGLEIYGILPNDEDGFFWMEWRRPSSPVHLEVFWIRGGPRNGNIEELIANYQGHDSLWRINAGDSLRRMSSFRVGDPFANKNLEFLSEYTRTAAKDGRWVVWDVPDEKVQASRDRSPVQMRWYDLPAPWRYAFLEAINGTGREVRRYFTRVLPKLEEISPMVKTGGWVFSKACLELRTGDQRQAVSRLKGLDARTLFERTLSSWGPRLLLLHTVPRVLALYLLSWFRGTSEAGSTAESQLQAQIQAFVDQPPSALVANNRKEGEVLSRTLGVGGLRQQLPPLGFEPREELGFVADGWHRLFRHKVLKLSNHHGDLVDALETCLWPYKTQEAAPPESVSMPTLEEVILETERVLRLLKEASPQTARGLLESWRWLSADDPTNFLTWAVFRVLAGMVAPDGAFATWRELFPPSLPQGGHAYTSVIEDQHKQALRGRPHVDRTVSCKFFWSLRLPLEDLTDQQIRGVSAVYYCFDETQYYMPPDVKPTASDAEPPPTGWEPTGSGE